MLKNLFVIALLLSTFLKNVNGVMPLAEISLKNVRERILNYQPEQLLELVRGERALPQDIAYVISKTLISDKPTLFFPEIDGYPRIKQVFQHDDWVQSAVFSPDGQSILTASGDHTAKLWNLNGGKPIATFHHGDWVYLAVFSPDGQSILTASGDYTAKLWTLNDGGEPIATFQHGGCVKPAVFSPDGLFILTVSFEHTAKLWNLNGKLITIFQHGDLVKSAVFSPDGQSVLTVSFEHTAKLWNLNGKLITIFQHGDLVKSAVFSPDGQFILTVPVDNPLTASYDGTANDGTAKLWNLNGEPIVTFHHDYPVNSAVFSPDGQSILTASADYNAKLWNLKGEPIATFNHSGVIYSAVFSPDGQSILTASIDNTAKLWNLNGELIATFHHDREVNSAVFSPNSLNVLTVSGKSAILWEIHPLWNSAKYRNGQLSLQELATILLILKHKGFVESNPKVSAIIYEVLNQIDGPADIPEEQRHIQNFFEWFLNA